MPAKINYQHSWQAGDTLGHCNYGVEEEQTSFPRISRITSETGTRTGSPCICSWISKPAPKHHFSGPALPCCNPRNALYCLVSQKPHPTGDFTKQALTRPASTCPSLYLSPFAHSHLQHGSSIRPFIISTKDKRNFPTSTVPTGKLINSYLHSLNLGPSTPCWHKTLLLYSEFCH